MFVSIQELEAAINYWRNQSPASGEALQLCAEASALAKPYAMMIVQGSARIPLDVLDETARSALKVFRVQRKHVLAVPPSRTNGKLLRHFF